MSDNLDKKPATKQAALAAAKKAKAKADLKQRLLAKIAEKEDKALDDKTLDDLKAQLAAL